MRCETLIIYVFGGFLSVSLAGLSVDRPCARAVKVDCPYPLSQVTARNSVVWALTEQRALLYREGVSSFCPEGEQWKCDIVRYQQEEQRHLHHLACPALGSLSACLPLTHPWEPFLGKAASLKLSMVIMFSGIVRVSVAA